MMKWIGRNYDTEILNNTRWRKKGLARKELSNRLKSVQIENVIHA